MLKILYVGAGGFIGSVSRYLIGDWVHRALGGAWFPLGTLAVNVFGCLIIGFLGGLTSSRQLFNPEARLFIFLGVLGGFTTFSTFGYETFALAQESEPIAAAANVIIHVILGLSAVWLGHFLSRMI